MSRKPRPDDDGRPVTMTPERLARRIDALAIDVVKVQHALRGLAAFLDREPIELDHDTLRTVASRLVDLGTRVRVGVVEIVAHRDESIEQPTLPLFDGPIVTEASNDAIPGAIGDPKPKRGRKPKSQPPTEDTDGQASDQGPGRDRPDGVAGDLRPGPTCEGPDVGATDGSAADATDTIPPSDEAGVRSPAVDPVPRQALDLIPDADAWRSIPLARILPESLADALKHDWEIETLDDLHQALSNGETLEDLVFTRAEAEMVRDAVRTLRADLGWGPEDGIPSAWLAPAGESGTWAWQVRKPDIPGATEAAWASGRSGVIEAGREAQGRYPGSILEIRRKKALAWERVEPEPFDFCSLHGGTKPGDEVDIVLRTALIDAVPESERREMKARGASDAWIREVIGERFGRAIDNDSPAPCPGGYTRGGKRPVLWVGDPTPKGKGDHKGKAAEWAKPTLQGPALIARVRQLLDIPKPAKAPKPARPKTERARQFDISYSPNPDGLGEWVGRVKCTGRDTALGAAHALFPGIDRNHLFILDAASRYGQDAINHATDSDWPEDSRVDRKYAIDRVKQAGAKLVAFKVDFSKPAGRKKGAPHANA